MADSFLWGRVASSSLVLGGVLALLLPLSRRALGLIMAFGAGVLISAAGYVLLDSPTR
jgi:zinc transporter, ZIP family